MSKGIRFELAMGRANRLVIGVILMVWAGRVSNARAQTVTLLHSFPRGGVFTDGDFPTAGLVQGSDGNFYGTTSQTQGSITNYGAVFRISPSGVETNLYSFFGHPTDGANPQAGLVQGSDGNFYGTTYSGGTSNIYSPQCYCYGVGTVFRISPSGIETTLYSFVGYPTDGANPQAGLVQGSDGNFYGTTYLGGTHNTGTVFRISPSGVETSLYSFVGSPNDGALPYAGLVQGSDGNFYGTTYGGGTHNTGTVFRISPSGSETTLYSFGSYLGDGANPQAGLVQGSDGNFYGTTYGGGKGFGTVFRISPSGTETTLYSFVGFGPPLYDGDFPDAGLVQGNDGNFYGTTQSGGSSSDGGTVFRISPSGSYSSIDSFFDSFPYAGLVQGSDGNFYGTTEQGGSYGGGTVFKLSVPLSPPPFPINQITSAQVAAMSIIFTIPSIAGENYQLQFSSSMNPTNWVNVPGVSVTNSIGALLTLTNFGGATLPQGFYRFAITP
jgi:uncharacterized repeat protein (TIGR03803 family)